jgi:gluconate 5-dehydrogenase
MAQLKQLFDLSGRVAIVTGGSAGLGLQMAEAFAEFGARLAICARKAERLAAAEARLRAAGAEVLAVACDIAKPEGVQALHAQVMARYGRADVLVNNAGRAWVAPAEELPLERWQQVFDLNVTAPFLLAQAFGREMIRQRRGSIINIASIAGLVGRKPEAYDSIAYGASKGALVNFTRDLAIKWARHGIRVNALCPGFFVTDINRKVYEDRPETIEREIPLGKPGGDDDLKGAALWLASDASRFVTGAVIPVDGGSTAW